MQKMSFVLGLLVGAVVATAWAQIPLSPGLDSSGRAINHQSGRDDDARAIASR